MMAEETQDMSDFDVWLNIIKDSFAKQGYQEVTIEDLWEFCENFLWKHKRPARYFEKVRDIMAIEPNDYFTYASLKAQVYNVSSLDEIDLEGLF